MTTTTETTTTAKNATPAISAAIDGTVLTLTFSHDPAAPLVIDATRLTPEVQQAAMMHGLKQKLVDAAAISRNPDTGRSATVEDKHAAVREVFDRLHAGDWNKRREAGTGGQSLLLAAMCKLYAGRKTETELREWIKGLTDEEQSTLRSSARVAPIIAEIKAARDAKKSKGVDANALFAELDGE